MAAGDAASLESYLTRFPKGGHAVEVGKRLEDLVWSEAIASKDPNRHKAFLNRFPNSRYAARAELQIEYFAYVEAFKATDVAQLDRFLGAYPQSRYRRDILRLKTDLESERIVASGTAKEVKALLKAQPKGAWAAKARQRLKDLDCVLADISVIAIIQGPDGNTAIIGSGNDSESVAAGDLVGKAMVISISRKSVTFKINGRKCTKVSEN